MKLIEHRQKYFEDLQTQVTIDKNGKKKYSYKYSGIWYQWGGHGVKKSKYVLSYILLELAGIALFIIAGVSDSSFNASKVLGGCSMLSIVFWLLELRGIFGFCFSQKYMMEIDYKSIHFRITTGAIVRILLLSIGLVCSLVICLADSSFDARGVLDFLFYALTVCSGVLIYRLQSKMGFRAYRNNDGNVGSLY